MAIYDRNTNKRKKYGVTKTTIRMKTITTMIIMIMITLIFVL